MLAQSSAVDAICASCSATRLEPVGDALAGNTCFAVSIQDALTNGIGVWFASIGSPSATPLPLFCGAVYGQLPFINLGASVLPGAATCDGSGSIPLPLPNLPGVFGTFLTAQSMFLCPQGGLGLTNAIEFPIGS